MSVCACVGVLPASTGTGSLLRVCLGAGEPMWLSGSSGRSGGRTASCHRRVPGAMSQSLCREVAGGGEWSWGSTSWPLCLPGGSPIANRGGLGRRHGLGREGVWGRVGERSSGCSRATGTGLGETELGKWSGEMPGAEVSARRPRDSRWPGRGEDGRLARAGGAVRRPSPHRGHPAQGTPLS